MRRITAIIALCALAACAPKMEDGSKAPRDPMIEVVRADVGYGTRLVVLRDTSTGCDYLSAYSDSVDTLTPRTHDGGLPVCGNTRASGFTILSVGELTGVDLVRMRDRDTGCEWLLTHRNEGGDLSPAIGRDGRQACGDRHATS